MTAARKDAGESMHLFFFGSLTDRELLELVLGRDCSAIDFRPAQLHGFATNRVKDESYPLLVPAPGSAVDGQLVGVLTEIDIARIRFFEDDEYVLEETRVQTVVGHEDCLVCLPRDTGADSGEPWQPESWSPEEREIFFLMTADFMAQFGVVPHEEALEMWEEFRTRAEKKVLARRRA